MGNEKTDKQIEQRKAELLRDFRLTLESAPGKNVLFEILSRCGITDNTFHQEERLDCYASGRKSVGYEILELMNYATVDGYYDVKRTQIERLKQRSRVEQYFPGARG